MLMTEQEYFTVDEVAKKLRVSKETIRRLIRDGELKIVRVGHQVRIHRDALDEYLKQK